MSTGSITQGSGAPLGGFTVGGVPVPSNSIVQSVGGVGLANDNFLFDLGLNLGYKIDWLSVYVNFVKNFGSFDLLPSLGDHSIDYTGYMVEGRGDVFCGPFTFTLGGFLASGDDFNPNTEDEDGNFRYPRGASHYWSEILGLGSLDQSIGGSYLNPVRATPASVRSGDQLNDASRNFPGNRGYMAADVPSNLWMVNGGLAYQALERTKLTLNYYYIGNQDDVISGFHSRRGRTFLEKDNSVGHELDFYIDQGIVDGLNLRIVGAYLIAEDAYTVNNNDDDAWEAGMVLQWHF
jgi:hypothetical protein